MASLFFCSCLMGVALQFLHWLKETSSRFPLGQRRGWWRWGSSPTDPLLCFGSGRSACPRGPALSPAALCIWTGASPIFSKLLCPSFVTAISYRGLLLLPLLTRLSALSRTWAAQCPSARAVTATLTADANYSLSTNKKKVTALTLNLLILNHCIQSVTWMKMHCSVQLNT